MTNKDNLVEPILMEMEMKWKSHLPYRVTIRIKQIYIWNPGVICKIL